MLDLEFCGLLQDLAGRRGDGRALGCEAGDCLGGYDLESPG